MAAVILMPARALAFLEASAIASAPAADWRGSATASVLARAMELEGVAGFVGGRSRGLIAKALNEEGAAWASEAFSAAMERRSRETGTPFSARDVLMRGNEIRGDVQAALAARLQQWLPGKMRGVIAGDVFGATAAREAQEIAEGASTIVDEGGGAVFDGIVADWYDAAVTDLKQRAMGASSGIADITDIRGSVDRLVDLHTMGAIAGERLGALIGDATARGIKKRVEDALDGQLPPEVLDALQRGPEEFEKFAAQAEKYLPGEKLRRLRESLLNRPVLKLPTAAYAALLAASAARHYALAFAGPVVDPHELMRGGEVTRVMVWQLQNKQWVNLSILQLSTIARGLADRIGAGEAFDAAVSKLREPLDRVQKLADDIDRMVKKPIQTVRGELENIVGIVQDELEALQDKLLRPIQKGAEKLQGTLDEVGAAVKEALPEKFNGIPPTWKHVIEDIGDGAPGPVVLGPSASILPEEEVPSRHPAESEELDPVLLHNGEFIHRVTDLVIPGRGIDFRFTRIYRGRSPFLGELGHQWTHSYAERLFPATREGMPGLTHVDEDGLKWFYRRDGDRFSPPPGVYATLRPLEDGSHEITMRDGRTSVFDAAGRLAQRRDRHGNRMAFRYDARGLLQAIVDPFGRAVTIERRCDGLIRRLRDFTGRSFRYDINARGELIGVTVPATPDFPKGKTTAYRYALLRGEHGPLHAMAMIVDPRGAAYLQNRSDENGRVTGQRYGDGPWMRVAYADAASSQTGIEDAGAVASRAWVTNSAGTTRLSELDARGQLLRRWRWEAGRYALLESHRYDDEGERVESCQPSGRCTRFAYGSGASRGDLLRQEEERPSGGGAPRITTIAREARFGRPLLVTDPLGNETRYEYAADGATDLLAIERRGKGEISWKAVARFQFDGAGQLVRQEDARGVATRYEYVPGCDPDGDGTPVPGAACPGGSGYLKKIIRDAEASSDRRDAGAPMRATTAFNYDPAGNIVAITSPSGQTIAFSVNALNQIVREEASGESPRAYRFDANDNLAAVEFDLGGRRVAWQFEYDALDRLIADRRQISGGVLAEARFRYGPDGSLVGATSPEGRTTALEYDVDGRPLCLVLGEGTSERQKECVERDADGEITTFIDGAGFRTRFERNGFGEVVRQVDPSGTQTGFERDGNGQIVGRKTIDADGRLLSEERWQLDDDGRPLVRRRRLWEGSDPERSRWVEERWEYDGAGNIVAVIDAEGGRTSISHDGLGNAALLIDADGVRRDFRFDAEGYVVEAALVANGQRVEGFAFGYDAAGRPAWVDRGGVRRQMRYDGLGRLTSVRDPGGPETIFEYDDLGRPIAMSQGDGSHRALTRYSWDQDGRLASIADPRGDAAQFFRDALGRLVAERFPDGTERRTAYDKRGLIAKSIGRDGAVVRMERDAMGRMVRRVAEPAGGGAGAVRQRFAYDGLGRLVLAVDEGDPASPDDDAVSRFAYDALSHPVAESSGNRWLMRQYDGAGRVVSMAMPSGARLFLARSAAGRLASIMDGAGAVASFAPFPPAGEAEVILGGHLSLVAERDNGGRLLRQRSLRNGAEVIANTEVRYDASGRVILEIGPREIERSFGRDSLGRLTLVEEGYGKTDRSDDKALDGISRRWSFAYDDAGNWTAAEADGRRLHFRTNTLDQYIDSTEESAATGVGGLKASGSTTPFTYDRAGNLVSDGRREFRYDALDRLVEVFIDGQRIAAYRYDAFDRRIEKRTEAGVQGALWDGWRLAEETTPAGGAVSYVYGEGIGAPVAAIEGGARTFLLADRIGSVIGAADEKGKIVAECAYGPFGDEVPQVPPALKSRLGDDSTEPGCNAIRAPFRFAGQIADEETGLVYLRHRYYDSALGRFLTPDPLGFKAQVTAPETTLLASALSYHTGQGAASRAAFPNRPLAASTGYDAFPFSRAVEAPVFPWRPGEANLYQYARGDPSSFTDPFGLASLVFDRSDERLSLFADDGFLINEYRATNRTVHPAGDPLTVGSNGPFPNGTYSIGVPDFISEDYREEVALRFEEVPFEPGTSTSGGRTWHGWRPGTDYHPGFGRIRIAAGSWSGNASPEDRIVANRGLFLHGGRHNYRKKTQGCIRVDDADLDLMALDFIQLRRRQDPVTTITVRD